MPLSGRLKDQITPPAPVAESAALGSKTDNSDITRTYGGAWVFACPRTASTHVGGFHLGDSCVGGSFSFAHKILLTMF
jgi:hypothetical protein